MKKMKQNKHYIYNCLVISLLIIMVLFQSQNRMKEIVEARKKHYVQFTLIHL